MSATARRAASVVVPIALALCACRRQPSRDAVPRPSAVPGASALASAKAHATPATSKRLVEDAAAGARSVAQWREHMKEEERERKLNYDRRKLREHERVLVALRQARKSYDSAKSEQGVRRAKAALAKGHTHIERAILAVDHWGVSSNVLGDYRAILKTLSDAYPTARIAALSGRGAPLAEVRGEVDGRLQKVEDWLERARGSRDE